MENYLVSSTKYNVNVEITAKDSKQAIEKSFKKRGYKVYKVIKGTIDDNVYVQKRKESHELGRKKYYDVTIL